MDGFLGNKQYGTNPFVRIFDDVRVELDPGVMHDAGAGSYLPSSRRHQTSGQKPDKTSWHGSRIVCGPTQTENRAEKL